MAVACGGTEERPKLERWGLSIWQSGTAISVPVLWAYESIDLSQVDAYGDWFCLRELKQAESPIMYLLFYKSTTVLSFSIGL